VHVAEYYKWIQATTLRGAKPPVLGQGRGPKPEAQSRVGWEKAASPPPASHGVWGKTTVVYIAVSMLPQWGPGQS